MNAIYTNHLTTLHEMLADVRLWADSPRKAALIEEYEAQIEEYTEMCGAEFEAACNSDENDVVLNCELETAVAWARGESVVAVADARTIAAQMEAMAPGCGMEHGTMTVWSVRVEMADGARGEVRLVVMRGHKSGALRWIGSK